MIDIIAAGLMILWMFVMAISIESRRNKFWKELERRMKNDK